MAPAAEVALSIERPTRVEDVLVAIGERVEPGQTLVQLERERSNLRLRRSGTEVASATVELDQATRALQRGQQLQAAGAIPSTELERAHAEVRRARAAQQAAVATRTLAHRDLRDGVLRSPVGGRIRQRNIEPGETAQPGHPLVVIEDHRATEVATWISERDVHSLHLGDLATVTAALGNKRTYAAKVSQIGPAADPRTGNFPARLTITNPDRWLRSGMAVSIEIETNGLPSALTVAQAAIVDRDRNHVVFVVVDGIARRITPRLGASPAQRVLVLEGLSAGDNVVVDGAEHLTDGSLVSVKAWGGVR